MKKNIARFIKWCFVGVVVMVLLYVGAERTGKYWMKDTAGHTRHQVEQLSTREQYELLTDRMARLWELTEQAQRAIDTGKWESLGIGGPWPGSYAPYGIAGTTGHNSYYIEGAKAHKPLGGVGKREDLDQFEAYVQEQGWAYTATAYTPTDADRDYLMHVLRAATGDGWYIWYTVRWNGYYTLDILSSPFWGDRLRLQDERKLRVFDEGPKYAVPGINPEFPAWDAPLVEGGGDE